LWAQQRYRDCVISESSTDLDETDLRFDTRKMSSDIGDFVAFAVSLLILATLLTVNGLR
jgi:hypothetical protein